MMQKMSREELGRILHNLCPKLGVEMHSDGEIADFLADVNFLERLGDINVPGILRRLEATVGRMREEYPALGPLETGDMHLDAPSVEDRVRGILGKIGNAIWELDRFGIESVDGLERYLRTFLSGRAQKRDGRVPENAIAISELNLSEKCRGGCKTCPIPALPSDPQMPWEIFEGAIESRGIIMGQELPGIMGKGEGISSGAVGLGNGEFLMLEGEEADVSPKPVGLGDGEVLLYPKLFEAVEKLVTECGCKVEFTTAGLIPPNRRNGIGFFRKLSALGPYASDVQITLSFNLLFGFINGEKSVGEYLRYTENTLDWIEESGAQLVSVIVLYPKGDRETLDAYERVREKVEGVYGFSGNWMSSGLEKREGIVRMGNACKFRKGTKKSINTLCLQTGMSSYGLRADGSLTTACGGFGNRSSSVGNLTLNSLEQLRALWKKHDERFGRDILQGPRGKCRRHQLWKRGRFTAPKSDNPLIRLRRA